MFDRTDRQLMDWAQRVLESTQITLTPPNNSQSGQGVSLYLMNIASAFPSHAGGRPPLQVALRYLVTTWADEPEEAHRMLGRLAFAAMESPDFEIEFEPLSAHDWLAFGTMPRPAFVLRVPARFVRPEPDTPLVQAPLVLQSTPTTTLRGRVLGPNGIPLPDVRVDLPMLQLTDRTDAQGWFRFSTVPVEPRTRQLRLSTKGRQIDVAVEQPAALNDPVVIHFNPFGTEGE